MSRGKVVEIPEASRQILAANALGILTTIRAKDGLPSTNPVGYVWDGESVGISTIASRVKYKNLLANPTIAFCVVDQADHTRYVELRGWATLEPDPDRSFLDRQFRRQSGGQGAPPDLDPPNERRFVIRIHPEQVSSPVLYGGRFAR
ncbi:MAG: PPOX class F420-dependent oxidoreductase [Deltaproteobacteria bacterium]|nr:PPOX class F420-dependent oxidoreductase [Deltaproteobacteria bacterium]